MCPGWSWNAQISLHLIIINRVCAILICIICPLHLIPIMPVFTLNLVWHHSSYFNLERWINVYQFNGLTINGQFHAKCASIVICTAECYFVHSFCLLMLMLIIVMPILIVSRSVNWLGDRKLTFMKKFFNLSLPLLTNFIKDVEKIII